MVRTADLVVVSGRVCAMSRSEAGPGLPPNVVMARLLDGFQVSQALFVVADAGVPTLLDRDGPTAVATLAERTGSDPEVLRRLIRSLAPVGVFSTDGDQVSLTPLGATLSQDHPNSLLNLAKSSMQLHYRPFGELRETLRTGVPAANTYYGRPYFEWIASDPARAAGFARAMATFARNGRKGVFDEYRLPSGQTIADIGGSDGSLLVDLLARDDDPTRRGIVFDLPETVPVARTLIAEAGLTDRIEVVAGDFFTKVPEADIYVLSWILHNWSDQDGRRILGSISAAAEPGARLLVIEGVVPSGDEPHPTKTLDLTMLGILGGKERTEQEFRELLDSAGFTLERAVPTPASLVILEATKRSGR
jgi:O-methyltransferase